MHVFMKCSQQRNKKHFVLNVSPCTVLCLAKTIHSSNVRRKEKNAFYKTKAIVLININTCLFMAELYYNKINKSLPYGYICQDIEAIEPMGLFFCRTINHNGCLPQI